MIYKVLDAGALAQVIIIKALLTQYSCGLLNTWTLPIARESERGFTGFLHIKTSNVNRQHKSHVSNWVFTKYLLIPARAPFYPIVSPFIMKYKKHGY